MDTCRRLVEREGVRYLILDLQLVQRIDVTAAEILTRLARICARARAKLVLAGARPDMLELLRRSKFIPNPAIEVISELDRATEWLRTSWCRQPARAFATPSSDRLMQKICKCCRSSNRWNLTCSVRGIRARSCSLSRRARLRLSCPFEWSNAEAAQVGPGTIVGEMALYTRQPRSADIVTTKACTVLRLTADRLAELKRTYPQVAIQFHAFLVTLLASRLASSTEEVRALA